MPKVRAAVASSLAGVTLLAASGAGAAMAATSAPATGVGTANAATTLLHIQLNGSDGTAGRVLDARIVNDAGQSTIDTSKYDPSAFARIAAAKIASAANPISGPVNFNTPTVESTAPGGTSPVSTPAVNLVSPSPTLTGLLPMIAAGTVDTATLTSALDATGATSSLTGAKLTGVSVVGGLVNASSASGILSLGTAATTTQSSATRSITIPTITAVDLSALLSTLGIKLGSLPVATVTSLVDQLKLPVAGPTLPTGMTVSGYVTLLQSTITQLTAATTGGVLGTIDSTLTTALGTLGLTAPTTLTAATTQITDLTGILVDTLTGAVAALDAAPLVQLGGGSVSVTSKAADTVANSVATVTGKIDSFKIGTVTLPGVDLAGDLAAASTTVNTAVGNVLKTISPDLANVVKVSLFDKSTSVTSADGYTKAAAGLTAVTASITAPDITKLTALIVGLTGGTGVASTISTLTGAAYTAPSQAMDVVKAFFPASLASAWTYVPTGVVTNGTAATTPVLSSASVKVGEITTSADFAPAVATPTSELPRTGGTIALAGLGFLLVAFGLWLGRAAAYGRV